MAKNIERLKEIMVLLRDPEKGCPWDIDQDFKSIAQYAIEEAYEVVDAIEKNDIQGLKEELGDLLLQVIFHSQMASEAGYFQFDDVVETLNQKMIKRHPHVFGDEDIRTAKEQEIAWEKQKEEERSQKAVKKGKEAGLLSGIAVTLPALTRSVKLQARAAKVGFDWPSLDGVFAKIDEELAELKVAVSEKQGIDEELGDLLFSISNLARKLDLDPETCVRMCNEKFIKRFRHIEARLSEKGVSLDDATLEEMDDLWNEAKTA